MRIVCEIAIAAPHGRVWQLIDDDECRKLWIPELVATTYPSGRPKGDPTGTRFRETMRDGASIRCITGEVAAHVPERLRAVRLTDTHLTMDITYRLGRGPTTTVVRYAGQFQLAGVVTAGGSGMMLGLARPLVEDRVRSRLAQLKAVAERASGR